ncbi:DUF445 family protein [Caldifermentibacillus hisashii]|uniref:DUF445 domain-containing protein n=1 Tax=Caldifermentibacillus hisashii TaxID=996558 RepID=UPI002E1C0B81|nr:DUF445 family protein [Caldibacillus thermoamylovorans]MED3644287.1 DUF445 family protein [Caldifermentibacillus hisashii]
MHTLITILFMGIVGAIIGGITNSIAIKMLFRPYEAKYIGNWRLPFTPGLIPKRRDELAKQMGQLVINHLLTPKVIQQKLTDPKIYDSLHQILVKKVVEFFQSEKTLNEWLEHIGMMNHDGKMEDKLYILLNKQMTHWINEHNDQLLQELIPETIWEKLDKNVNKISKYLLINVKQFLVSPSGYHLIKHHFDQFFEGRGRLLNMLHPFLDNRNMIERLQQELVKIIENDQTEKAVTQVLQSELDRVKSWTVEEGVQKLLGKEGKDLIWEELKKFFFHKPLKSFPLTDLKNTIINQMIPTVVQKGMEKLGSTYIEKWMKKLEIPELVKNQVDSFSTEQLEEIVVGISRRELKMITYLGAYLGGLIGILQGFIVILMG